MYVFSYDRRTRAFTGGIPAEFDQREPGRLICPAFATRIAPPKHDSSKEWPVFVPDPKDIDGGGHWKLLPIIAPPAEPEAGQ